MSLERELDKAAKDMRDAANELKHRTTAGAERLDRDTDPGTMSEGDRMRSRINEAKNDVQADMDRAKRKVREET